MSRIDPPHLAWVLEGLVAGEVRNRIQVDGEVAEWARVALGADAGHHLTARASTGLSTSPV